MFLNQLHLIDILLFDLDSQKKSDHSDIGNTAFDNDTGILFN